MKLYLAVSVDHSLKRMGDYMAGAYPAVQRRYPAEPIHILLSYHFFKKHNIDEMITQYFPGRKPVFFADSGAFSAWSKGYTITVDEYVAWLKRWGHNFTCAAALDVLGDAEGSWRQTEEMRAKMGGTGPEIIPVVHSNDNRPWDWLKKYIDAGYTYIGISPTGPMYGAPRLMAAWMKQAEDRRPPNVRYHAFGVTGLPILKAFDLYSADSSTWTMGLRYARLSLFDERVGRSVIMNMRDAKDSARHRELRASYGLSIKDLDAEDYDKGLYVAATTESWVRQQAWLNRWHAKAKRERLAS